MEVDLVSAGSFDFDTALKLDPLKREDVIKSAIEKNECFLIVTNDVPVGFVIFSHNFFGRGFLELIEIKDDFQRKGYGSAAIEEVSGLCKTDKLFTSTNESNEPMKRLLAKSGFVFAGKVEGLDEGDPELFYYKTLRANVKIRCEGRPDYDKIYELIKTAFQTAKTPPSGEEDYAVSLRNSERYIPELALIAEADGKIVGQVMLTKTYIDMGDRKYEALLLGPVAVLLEHRCQGVGSQLMREALRKALTMGYKAVFLCGDPDYYNRFGFREVGDYGITYGMDVPAKYVLVCELESGWLKDKQGSVSIM
jgi:putative acetyltransferase